jgi:hypothetical protein
VNRVRSCFTAALLIALLPGCGGVPAAADASSSATNVAAATNSPAITQSRPLAGAGAVAFDAVSATLAWADGEHVRLLDLAGGEVQTIPAGATVSDLGYSPQGDLWIVAGHIERRHGATVACRSRETDMQRLLGVDGDGIAAAGYAYSDGIGPLRHQIWLDEACHLQRESTAPLPDGVSDADADPGEAHGRASLHAPRAVPPAWLHRIDGDRLRFNRGPVLALPSAPAAVSPDGRWWVFGAPGQRTLWRLSGTH